MKISALSLSTATLLLALGTVAEDEKTHKQPTPAPFPNYWDANAWEKGSGDSFWRSSTEAADKRGKTGSIQSKPKQKQSTSFKGFFNRQTER